MTAQQQANALLRQHQLERILKDLELDIAQVVTAQYHPHQSNDHIQYGLPLNDRNGDVVKALAHFEEYFA